MAKISGNKWFQLVTMLAPVILANVKGGDKIAPVIPAVVAGITEAEQIKGGTGEQKKAHVKGLATAAVAAANATGKIRLDDASVQASIDQGIDAVIAAVNAVHKAAPQE